MATRGWDGCHPEEAEFGADSVTNPVPWMEPDARLAEPLGRRRQLRCGDETGDTGDRRVVEGCFELSDPLIKLSLQILLRAC